MIRIKHINAFTRKPFLGNPAAVVTKANGLTEKQMQLIAREMNLSETAFVLRPTRPGADLRLRWFTPTAEVNFCGHATVASFHALVEEGCFGAGRPGQYSVRLETRSGILPVSVRKRSARGAWVQVQLPQSNFSSYKGQLVEILAALQVKKRDLLPHLPVQIDSRRMLYIPFDKLRSLFEMKPNFDQLRQIGERDQLHGVCVFTPETVDQKSTFHSRFFAPNYGINEDPVTGSSNGPLGAYFYHQGLLTPTRGKCLATGEQGDVLGRKGRVSVEVELGDENVNAVRIGGEAVTVFEAPLKLNL
jgi:trans-2,3-dihydro-3-hydroxyanthranilate isomerase